jgi:streptogramin lyase
MAALLAGCSGGGSTPPVMQTPSNPQSQTGSVAVSIVVPAASTQPAVRKGSRKPNYMSASSQGLGISVVAHGGTFPAMVTPQAAYDVSASSSYCTAGTGGSRTCTFFVPAPAGSDDFQISAWDAKAVAGSFVGAHLLGQSVSTQTISATTVNNLSFSLSGTVASIFLRLSTNTMVAGQSNTATLNAEALDADGNIIAGSDPFVDSNGNSLTFTVRVTDLPANSAGAVTMTSANQSNPSASVVVTKPSNSTISLSYNGALLGSAAFVATPSHSLLGTNTNATLNFTVSNVNLNLPPDPVVTNYSTGAGSAPFSIGTDTATNDMWFTDQGDNTIGRIGTDGTISKFGPTTAQPRTMAMGADGDMYFTELDRIGRINPYTQAIDEFTAGLPLGSLPGFITRGPASDNDLWFSDLGTHELGTITFPGGAISEIPVDGSPYAVAIGPDGNVWYTRTDNDSVEAITTAGTVVGDYPLASGANPRSIGVGPDGNLWVTENSGNQVARITTSGTVTEFPLLTANAQPRRIIAGIDGALWFTEQNANKIGRITTDGHVSEYSVSATGPIGMTSGPDGNLWFAANTGNAIGKVQP